jgi:hypothetical protein
MTRGLLTGLGPGHDDASLPSSFVLAERQNAVFIVGDDPGPLAPVRHLQDGEIALVRIPASAAEIRTAELLPEADGLPWPRVAARPDLLVPIVSRLISGEHAEILLEPGHDGLKAALITHDGNEQPLPVPPMDALGLLAALFGLAPRGVVRTGSGLPPRALLSMRPSARPRGYRARLAGTVLTRSPAAMTDLGLQPSMMEFLFTLLEQPSGMLLVSGTPGSGRSTTLGLLAAALAERGLRGGLIGPPEAHGGEGPKLEWLADAPAAWPFATSLHPAAPDFVLIDRIARPADVVLAARLASAGTLVLGGAPGADPELLARNVAEAIQAASVPPVPVTVIGQALVRTVCRGCTTWETLPSTRARRLGLHPRDLRQIERSGGLAVPAGKGCADCSGTGAAGLTGVFEIAAPGEGAAVLPRMREDGWHKAVRGIVLYEDVAALPAIHRGMRTLREIAALAGESPGPTGPDQAAGKEPAAAAEAAATAGPREAESYVAAGPGIGEADALAGHFRAVRSGGPIDPNFLPALARALATRGGGEARIAEMLVPMAGFVLARHSVNTALLASRLACTAEGGPAPEEVALAGLLHDAGLIEAGIDPGAELPPILSEEALDPGEARFSPGRVLRALGIGQESLASLITEVHAHLRFERPPAERPRADLSSQAVALACLLDLTLHGPRDQRPADLHEVTSLAISRHGARFSPALFRALLRAFPIFPIGAFVELSSGDLARVVSQNEENYFRPRLEITATAAGECARGRRMVDLARTPFLHIRQRVVGTAPASWARA